MSKEQAEKVAVTVLSAVRHDRVLYGPGLPGGDRLELSPREAEHLESIGVVKRDAPAEKTGAQTADDDQVKDAAQAEEEAAAARAKAEEEAAAKATKAAAAAKATKAAASGKGGKK